MWFSVQLEPSQSQGGACNNNNSTTTTTNNNDSARFVGCEHSVAKKELFSAWYLHQMLCVCVVDASDAASNNS